MKILLQVLAGSLSGGTSGAVIGALLLGLSTYSDTSSGWLGTARSWSPLAAFIGVIYGFIFGAFVGLVAAVVKSSTVTGVALGAGLMLLTAIYFIYENPYLKTSYKIAVALFVPGGAVVGLLSATAVNFVRDGNRP